MSEMTEHRAGSVDHAFPPVASLTLWELAQAIALNSDMAMRALHERDSHDGETARWAALDAEMTVYLQRRNDCIAEIRDREAFAPVSPVRADREALVDRGQVLTAIVGSYMARHVSPPLFRKPPEGTPTAADFEAMADAVIAALRATPEPEQAE